MKDAQACTYDKSDYHRPAGRAEKMIAVKERQPKETGTQRNGNSVVSVAAEDAHKKHQSISSFEIFQAYSFVLADKEWHNALGA